MGTESDAGEADGEEPLPADVIEEAERLTRLAREADHREASDRASGDAASREADHREARDRAEVEGADEAAAYRSARDDLLAEHGFTARVREEPDGAVLVLHPDAWLEDGTVQIDRIEDVSRGIEMTLSGVGNDGDWPAIETHNREIADAVDAAHGDPHGATAHALADFASNHYAKPIEALTADERREFREEYFPRNAWPTPTQREQLAESVRLTLEAADAPFVED